MPLRNGGTTVRVAITSTLRAMPSDSELVIWDDASSDESVQVVETIRDRRVRLLRSDRTVGVGAALRAMCTRSDSRFIARMDADDVCFPWRFAVQSARIRGEKLGILFSPVVRFRASPVRISPSAPAAIAPAALPLHLAVMCVVMHPTMFASRHAIESAGGYREGLAEDYDLWLRAATAGVPMARMWVPTLGYRLHDGQVSLTAEYTRRLRADAVIAQSYRDFARVTLGLDTTWNPTQGGHSSESVAAARQVGERLHARAAHLSPWQRKLLERTMRRLPV
jgi:glycosyltransferase involved in cell wall biosynthesis